MPPRIKSYLLILALFTIHLLQPVVTAEYYKYVDQTGTSYFVDDITKIPPQYRKNITVYNGQQEFPKKAELLEKKSQKLTVESIAKDSQGDIKKEQIDKNIIKPISSENQHNTEITIENDLILIPVTLGYRGREIKTQLMLDTGAARITLHADIARRLGMNIFMRSKMKIGGGRTIKAGSARLNYVRVGSRTVENPDIWIIKNQGGPTSFTGFLGMNFISENDFTIDFKNKLIRWGK